jgi:TolB protein
MGAFTSAFPGLNFWGRLLFLTLTFLCLSACDVLNNDDELPPCPPIRIGAQSPYAEPAWHPSGECIGFNYTPLERIEYPYGDHCQGEYFWKDDSAGFWLINVDGTNMRRILPFKLYSPAWSPDGQWIAFFYDYQIFKMVFSLNTFTFDTASIVQLTTEGRNFFPTWSPDGQWIAFDSNNDSPNGMNFIWKMRSDGSTKIRLAYTPTIGEVRQPSWSKVSDRILHTRHTGNIVEDIFAMNSLGGELVRLTNNTNPKRTPKYSIDETKIAFSSWGTSELSNIWWMDNNGSNIKQLTTEGTADFDWSPDGQKIVYLDFRVNDWSYKNGTLWLLNVYSGEKKQLTFNSKPND